MASMFGLRLAMRFGRATVTVGGMSGLVVEPALWGRECVEQLFDVWQAVAEREAIDLVVGFGLPHYYDRWGAAPVVPSVCCA